MSVFLGEAFEHEGYFVVITTAPPGAAEGGCGWSSNRKSNTASDRCMYRCTGTECQAPLTRSRRQSMGVFNTRITLIEGAVVVH